MKRIIVAAMSIAPCALACAQGAYVVPLGDLPGSIFQSDANDISADGKVVVGESQSYGGFDGFQAFRWTAETGMVGLGELPGGRATSRAGGISPDGRWISGYSNSGAIGWEACVWTADNKIIPAGRLPGGTIGALADISNNGVACGISRPTMDNNIEHAVRWTSETGMVDLGTLGGRPTDSSRAAGISDDGRVIIGRSSAPGGEFGFRWTQETGMVALPSLPDKFGLHTADAMSHNGQWIVGNAGQDAVVWGPDGTIRSLGRLHLGISSSPRDISDDGRVVVGNGGFDPFIWTESWGMRTLNSVMLDYGIDLVALRYDIVDITGISADGSTMCAIGFSPEGTEAFLIHIPAPGVTLLPLGAGVLIVRRVSRRSH